MSASQPRIRADGSILWLFLVCLTAGVGIVTAATSTITVGPLPTYTPAVLWVKPGDTVVWAFVGGTHSVTQGINATSCDALQGGFDSGFIGGFWNQTFKTQANIHTFCRNGQHCVQGMHGLIYVQATPPATPPATSYPSPYVHPYIAPPPYAVQTNAPTNSQTFVPNSASGGGSVTVNQQPPILISALICLVPTWMLW
ncbi:hypothetical protein SeMB42_g02659 [Synchytrium endobioticum]|uniref:Phytocyanin domain-containing protein n=1 Tax=Synchytrium endobioticum TaxID=286115 RepID=A0A507DC91_9FUNG|nr:hypothetical protein SeMB42_g02659 [Synchytrium endobioticum]